MIGRSLYLDGIHDGPPTRTPIERGIKLISLGLRGDRTWGDLYRDGIDPSIGSASGTVVEWLMGVAHIIFVLSGMWILINAVSAL